MKPFKIPVTWEVYGTIEVYADSLDEAIEKFDNHETEDGYSLPIESDYVDGSFERADYEFCLVINHLE